MPLYPTRCIYINRICHNLCCSLRLKSLCRCRRKTVCFQPNRCTPCRPCLPPIPPCPMPAKPVILSPGEGEQVEGTLYVSGTAERNNLVTVCIENDCYNITADAIGQWSLAIERIFSEGSHTITARQTNSCGRVSDGAHVTFAVPPIPGPDIVLNLRVRVVDWNPNYPFLSTAQFNVVQGAQTHVLTSAVGYGYQTLVPYTEWVLPRNGRPVIEAILEVPYLFALVGYQVSATQEDNDSAPMMPTAVIDTDTINPVWITATITID